MALLGKSFQNYVKKQISQRQDSLGEGFGGIEKDKNGVTQRVNKGKPRSLKTLNIYNSSTPFMRLASAVSITKGEDSLPGNSVYKQILNEGLFDGIGGENSWKETRLAKAFVLQGAPNNSKGDAKPSGVNLPGSKNVAYGWGYDASQINSDEGYVPPPGVTNVEFEYKNDGALAFATISIKAFSATQFSMIDILYMRPGYTCLLEFGHSMYYNNKNELVNLDTVSTKPFEYLFNPKSTSSYLGMAEKMRTEKSKHDGNYEGFFGRISKFSWKFNMDGSYDITVKLIGLGDVISSLKVNLPVVNSTPTTFSSTFSLSGVKDDEYAKGATVPIVISDAQATQLNFELYAIQRSEL